MNSLETIQRSPPGGSLEEMKLGGHETGADAAEATTAAWAEPIATSCSMVAAPIECQPPQVQGSAAAQGGRVGEESRGGRSSLRRCSSGQASARDAIRIRNLLVGLTILSYRVYKKRKSSDPHLKVIKPGQDDL